MQPDICLTHRAQARITAALALAVAAVAHAAPPQPTEAACQKDVKDYVNALRFVKEASGTGIGARVERAFLTEADLARILQREGPCGAAQALRQRRVAP